MNATNNGTCCTQGGILRKSLSEKILSQAAACGKKNFKAVTTTGYVYLGLAIVLELCGTTCMKLSDGFDNKFFAAGTLIFYGICFYVFALSLKTVPLNIAYATWGGLGVVLAAVVAKIFFHETISTPGLIGIVLIVVGVVLCNFFGANH